MNLEKMYENYWKTLPKYGLGIDWETSGSTWGGDSSIEHQGISFGAVIFDIKSMTPVKTLYREIKFNDSKYKWSLDAQNIHGLTKEHLNEYGVFQEDAAMDLAEFISDNINGKVIFLGHNDEFDIRFTRQLFSSIGIQFTSEPNENEPYIALHHVKIDTSGLGLVLTGIHKSDLLFDVLGFEQRKNHNALEDILMTLESCRIMKKMFQGDM